MAYIQRGDVEDRTQSEVDARQPSGPVEFLRTWCKLCEHLMGFNACARGFDFGSTAFVRPFWGIVDGLNGLVWVHDLDPSGFDMWPQAVRAPLVRSASVANETLRGLGLLPMLFERRTVTRPCDVAVPEWGTKTVVRHPFRTLFSVVDDRGQRAVYIGPLLCKSFDACEDAGVEPVEIFRDVERFNPIDERPFLSALQEMIGARLAELPPDATPPPAETQERETPVWNADEMLLSFRGTVVRRFRRKAPNAVLILQAFHEEGWPSRVDSPFRQTDDRLREGIRTLNDGLSGLRFERDGTGEGVRWTTNGGGG